jgi:hypothetical protein
MVPATGLRGGYFLSTSDVESHMINCTAAATNHKTATSYSADYTSSSIEKVWWSFVVLIYRGSSVLLCGGKFHFCYGTASFFYMCDVNYSVLSLRICFYIYVYACPGVLHITDTDNVAWV